LSNSLRNSVYSLCISVVEKLLHKVTQRRHKGTQRVIIFNYINLFLQRSNPWQHFSFHKFEQCATSCRYVGNLVSIAKWTQPINRDALVSMFLCNLREIYTLSKFVYFVNQRVCIIKVCNAKRVWFNSTINFPS